MNLNEISESSDLELEKTFQISEDEKDEKPAKVIQNTTTIRKHSIGKPQTEAQKANLAKMREGLIKHREEKRLEKEKIAKVKELELENRILEKAKLIEQRRIKNLKKMGLADDQLLAEPSSKEKEKEDVKKEKEEKEVKKIQKKSRKIVIVNDDNSEEDESEDEIVIKNKPKRSRPVPIPQPPSVPLPKPVLQRSIMFV